jgi:hypothetical protein
MVIENQILIGHIDSAGAVRFRFSPKDEKTYRYTVRSNATALDGKTGEITAVAPSATAKTKPSEKFPNWWTDDPAPEAAEGVHIGARTVSRWRDDFLPDFSERMRRCASTASDLIPP